MKPSETLESRHSREWWFFSKLKDALADSFLAPLSEVGGTGREAD